MNWFRVLTNNGWRVFSEEIAEAYLKKTSSGRSTPEPVDDVIIDLPGMIPADRTYQELDLDGLEVTIPSMDFEILHALLLRAKVTVLPGGTEIVKLRGSIEGLVMTVKQRDTLVRLMDEIMPAVTILGDKENKRFSSAFTGGSPFEPLSWRDKLVKQQGDKDERKPN